MANGNSEGVACSPFSRYALDLQGFSDLNDTEKKTYELALRFTPAVCTVLAIVGTLLQWPVWQFILAGVALLGALHARGNLIDAAYNNGVRHLFKAPMTPANPRPRRFACLIVAVMLTGSGLGFLVDLPAVGLIVGGALAVVLALNAFTNWCLGSWMYRIMRLPA